MSDITEEEFIEAATSLGLDYAEVLDAELLLNHAITEGKDVKEQTIKVIKNTRRLIVKEVAILKNRRQINENRKSKPALVAYTDYPILKLGDKSGELAPIRKVEPISFDQDKYVTVEVEGIITSFKGGYLYKNKIRYRRNAAMFDVWKLPHD